MGLSQVTEAVAFIDPLIGLMLVVLGLSLARLNRDPGIKLLVVWGVVWVISGAWNGLFHVLMRSSSLVALHWANAVSFLLWVGARLLTWGTAGYALWRFWQATWSRDSSG